MRHWQGTREKKRYRPGDRERRMIQRKKNPQDRCALRRFSEMFKRKHRASVGCTPLDRWYLGTLCGFLSNSSAMCFVLWRCLCLPCFQHASSQGVGVLRSFSPTSLFEHMSMGQARNPPQHWITLRVYPVLLCPLWPCFHRMCVITKETGLSP